MRIAMIGAKGIPAAISLGGGVETHVEELSTRLVEHGHKVTVYCRPYANPDDKKNFKGIKLITLPTIHSKNLDTITSTFLASIHALFQPYDIIHYHAVGPSTLAWIPRLFKWRAKVVVTFHSRDRFHEKWGWFARKYLAFGEWTAVTFPHATIAASHGIQLFCKKTFGKFVWYVPNGVDLPAHQPGSELLKNFGLHPNNYFYTLCRFVPHKAIDDAIKAFAQVKTSMKLVIIGFASAGDMAYQHELERLAKKDPRVLLVGRRVGKELEQLVGNAYALIHPSRSEGLSFSILEAMSYGKMVVMSDIPENLELVDHSGIAYKVGDIAALRETLQWVIGDPKLVEERGARAREIVRRLYSWDSVVERTEALYSSLVRV